MKAVHDNWQGLELRHLTTLVAVAEEESFARAAARLGYTPSAVSQQITALERIVGERLVERASGRRIVALTHAGTLLIEHAGGVLDQLAAARVELREHATGTHVSLALGIYPSLGTRLVPSVLLRLAQTNPEIDLRLHEAQSDDELVGLVRDGVIDATFAALPLDDGPYEAIEVLRDPYVLLVRHDAPLARAYEPPTSEELSALDLIGFQPSRSARRAEVQFRLEGIRARTVRRCTDFGILQGLVAAGFGAALVPSLLIDGNDGRIAAVPLGDRITPRAVALAWHRDGARSSSLGASGQAVMHCARSLEPFASQGDRR